jgi:hypothetical protein
MKYFDQLRVYMKRLIDSMNNLYGLCSLLIVIVLFFIPNIESYRTDIIPLLLVIIFFFAGFNVWKKDRRTEAKLKITKSEPEWNIIIYNAHSIQMVRMSFQVTLCNNSPEEPFFIEQPELNKIKIDTQMFEEEIDEYKISTHSDKKVVFPYKIPQNDIVYLNFILEFNAIPTEEANLLIDKLLILSGYSLNFNIKYRNISSVDEYDLKISGSLDQIAQNMLKNWEVSNNTAFANHYRKLKYESNEMSKM